MIVEHIKGDIFEYFSSDKFRAMAHGCNCHGTMGAGVAYGVATKYPEARIVDRLQFESRSASLGSHHDVLGHFTSAETRDGMIYNLYTQFHPGRVKCDIQEHLYNHIRKVFRTLENTYRLEEDTAFVDTTFRQYVSAARPLLIPKIGAGIAGGDWREIENIINNTASRMPIVCVTYPA